MKRMTMLLAVSATATVLLPTSNAPAAPADDARAVFSD